MHWRIADWLPIQLDYLRRYLDHPAVTYCFYTGFRSPALAGFDVALPTEVASHARKLNRLADLVCERAAEDEDVLVFIDGDAFPVRPLSAPVTQALASYPLMAIQRLESGGDLQPHPSFCATTVGFWREIGGDWSAGHCWRLSNGQMRTDIGGNLLGELEARKIEWLPLTRTGGLGEHGMYYGIYGDLIYHHGAGFREPYSTFDMLQSPALSMLHLTLPHFVWRRLSPHLRAKRTVARNAAESRAVRSRLESGMDVFGRDPGRDSLPS